MDLSTATATPTPTATACVKTPEAETEAPTRIQPTKPLSSFTNGVLKRHPHPLQAHHHHLPAPPAAVVTYKECLKNHAAALGGHAVDGCGEFMPSPAANPTDPTSLKCAACGCHRNFHRRDPDEHPPPNNAAQQVIEYQPHHRHHPPPPPQPLGHSSPNSASPPPISSSAPHMLLALSGGLSAPPPEMNPSSISPNPNGRKRFRTKFTQNQREGMLQCAESLGWKMQRKDEEVISEFCGRIGVEKGVFKVWMHNNKNTFGKRTSSAENTPTTTTTTTAAAHYHHHDGDNGRNGNEINSHHDQSVSHHTHHHNNGGGVGAHGVATINGNGSSSSS